MFFLASLAPAVVANCRNENPVPDYAAMSSAAAVATAISANISSRSKSSRAPALWASWRIGIRPRGAGRESSNALLPHAAYRRKV